MQTIVALLSLLILSACNYNAGLLGSSSEPSLNMTTKPTDAKMTVYSAKAWYQDPTPYLTFFGPFDAEAIVLYNSADCSGSVLTEKTLNSAVTTFVDVQTPTLSPGQHYFSARLRFNASEQSECISMSSPYVYSPKSALTSFMTDRHSMSLKSDGSVAVWGDLSRSQTLMQKMPLLTSGVTKIFQEFPGALKSDGSLVFWSDMTPFDPTVLDLNSEIVDAAGSKNDFSVLKSNGDVWTWGWSYGQETIMATNAQKIFWNNSDAFAALKNDGSVVAWGDLGRGGDTAIVAPDLASNVVNVFTKTDAFAALKANGSIVAWGDASVGGDISAISALVNTNVQTVVSNEYAFAALKNDGSVFTWGDSALGGDTSLVAASLSSGVQEIIPATESGFAVLKTNGSVVTWGSAHLNIPGGMAAALSTGVVKVVATDWSFAALKSDGSVVSWGRNTYMTDWTTAQPKVASQVVALVSNKDQFLALKSNGAVVGWGMFGEAPTGEDIETQLASGVTQILSDNIATFMARKSDGTYITFDSIYYTLTDTALAERLPSKPKSAAVAGDVVGFVMEDGSVSFRGHGPAYGDSFNVAAQISSGVKKLYGNDEAMAAIKNDGSVVVWGTGDSTDTAAVAAQLTSGVESIYKTARAFAALKTNGSLIVWGDAGWGGNTVAVAASLTSGVVKVAASDGAFAVLKADGSVITWGSNFYGADKSAVAGAVSSGVTEIVAGLQDFAAIKADGTVVSWGTGPGEDSSMVTADLVNVVSVVASRSGFSTAFAALRADGSVITWGDSFQGGDSSGATAKISSGVKSVVGFSGGFVALKTDDSIVGWSDPWMPLIETTGVESVVGVGDDFVIHKKDGSMTTGMSLFYGDPYTPLIEAGGVEAIAVDNGFIYIRKDGALLGKIPRTFIEM
ncbi:RCC1 domain-containing protein [Bdellovibrio sp. HCB337]|uniref:RCC1 domain-containing protein n=1 Tax=Bdellovibrio sp. HCB337 TaxID=3394358 RepID=UPI0039A6DEEE